MFGQTLNCLETGSHRWRIAWLTLALTLLPIAAAEAGIIVTIDDRTINAGGTEFVDVWIRTDAADSLLGFGLEFELSTVGGRELAFAVDGSGKPSATHLADNRYVFFSTGSSAIAAMEMGSVGPTTIYAGTDASDDSNGAALSADALLQNLLVRLEITTITGNPPLAGDVFQLSLLNNGNTYFIDSDANFLTFNPAVGQITIESAAVPEPSSFALLSLLGFAVAGRSGWTNHMRRRRSRAS